MGKIKIGAWSAPSGKIGNLVAGKWRGINFLRSMPEKFTDANTLLQQEARMRMRLVVKFLKTCKPVIRLGYLGSSTPTRAAFHAATSYNYHHALTGEFPALAVDYPDIMVARGSLPTSESASCQAGTPGVINFTWDAESEMEEAKATDTAIVLVHNPSRNYSVYRTQGISRQDGSANITVPSLFTGEEVHCYLFFANLAKLTAKASEEYISNSMYLGKVTVA